MVSLTDFQLGTDESTFSEMEAKHVLFDPSYSGIYLPAADFNKIAQIINTLFDDLKDQETHDQICNTYVQGYCEAKFTCDYVKQTMN